MNAGVSLRILVKNGARSIRGAVVDSDDLEVRVALPEYGIKALG
ncbi:hypothetical protein STXM2123_994 [Streptomyces sp. F-3]|nr:hypothetical protein STXM2123_994 [Streptomyces sp. F-3]